MDFISFLVTRNIPTGGGRAPKLRCLPPLWASQAPWAQGRQRGDAEGRSGALFRRGPLFQLAQSSQPLWGRDVVRVEPIQQKVTGMIKGMENQAHEERLKGLPLFSLEKRDSD